MRLSRSQRKIILLYARLIELFQSGVTIEGGQILIRWQPKAMFVFARKGAEIAIADVQYLDEHRTAQTAHAETLGEIDEALVEIFKDKWKSIAPLTDDELQGVFSFGEVIGIPRARARYMIDQEFARELPTYAAAALPRQQAEDFVGKFGGLYFLYRHDMNAITEKQQPLGVLVRATVSIRYPVPYASLGASKKGRSRVRCKINIPSYDRKATVASIHKCDGYVRQQSRNLWHWLMQTRSDNHDDGDLLLMYTSPPAESASRGKIECMHGVMLSQNQEDERRPTISNVVLVRQSEYRVLPNEHSLPQHNMLTTGTIPSYLGSYPSVKRLLRNGADTVDPEFEERDFMRTEAKIIDLAQKSLWSECDRAAVEHLFRGWPHMNLRGLHC